MRKLSLFEHLFINVSLKTLLPFLLLFSLSTAFSQEKPMLTIAGHTAVSCVCFSPDGKYALTGSGENTFVKLWEISSGKEVRTFSGHTIDVLSVCFSPDGKYALSGSIDKTLKLWEISSGKEVRTFSGHTMGVLSVCFSPDGKYALSGSSDKTLKLWEISTGKEIRTFSGHTKDVISVSVCFSSDGKYALSNSDDKAFKLWEISTGKEIRTFLSSEDLKLWEISTGNDGKYALSRYLDYLKLWEISSGKKVKTFSGHTVDFSPDGKYALSGGYHLKLWEISSRKEVRTFSVYSHSTNSVCISFDGKYALLGGDYLKLWEISTGREIRTFSGYSIYKFSSVCFSPDGKYAISGSLGHSLKLWEISSGKEIRTFSGNVEPVFSVCFSPDGKYVLSGHRKTLKLWEISTGKKVRTFSGHSLQVNSVCFSPDGKYALSGSNNIKLWEISTGKEVRTFVGSEGGSVCFSPDGKYALSGSYRGMKLWEISTGKEVRTFLDRPNAVCFSPDGKYVLSGHYKTIKLWEISTGKEVRNFSGHSHSIISICISPDGKKVISSSDDKTIKIWDIETGSEIVSWIVSNNNWLVITPDMYFDCSKDGGESVSIALNNHGYNIDQFALKYNRPDIILQRLGNKDQKLIQHYYHQYKKRLRKAGFTEEQLSAEIHVPVASITDTKQEGKFVNVNFTLSDDKYNLKKYNIYVNDVPLFGGYGKDITGQNNLSLSEKIELTGGTNKIEISCINEKGAESFRVLTYAEYKEKVKGDLYFIAFGVSKYKDTDLNLQYADKDAKDLAETFGKMKGAGFNNVYIKTYLNEEVTTEAIKNAKSFLANAKVDDTFVLSISGHGKHDTDPEATYYFLTSNTDLNNLAGTAANFEMIEDLLQGIAPRNKLFLMDACESGELDEETETMYYAEAGSKGLNARGFKRITGTEVAKHAPREYLFEKDRFIYNDLSRRSGAIVFSSSKGNEFSYERSDIENGLFTESILKALTGSEADKNKDGTVTSDELRDYVIQDVSKTSNDLQHPTVDRDNIYQKFGFPKVK